MRFGSPCADVGDECFGRECAWWLQKMRTVFGHGTGSTEAAGIESEGCAVAYAAAKGGGHWMLNNGGSE